MYRLVLAWQTFAGYPIVLTTSRDGRRAPTRPLTELRDDPRAVVSHAAGVEETVLGYNEHGVVVFAKRRPTARQALSLRDVLGHRSAAAAARAIERAITPETATGDLLVCDARAALSIETGGEIVINTLTPGVHVFVGPAPDPVPEVDAGRADGSQDTNRVPGTGGESGGSGTAATDPVEPDGSDDPSESSVADLWGVPAPRAEIARWLYDGLQPEPGESGPEWCRRAKEVLGDHEHGVCVHRRSRGESGAGAGRYGRGARTGGTATTPTRIETRSAASLVIDGASGMEYTYADGPPCTTPFRPVARIF